MDFNKELVKQLKGLRRELEGIKKELKSLRKTDRNEKVNCRYAYCCKQPSECTCTNERDKDSYDKFKGKETGRSFGI